MGKHAVERHEGRKRTTRKKQQRGTKLKSVTISFILLLCIIVGVSISLLASNGKRKVEETANNFFIAIKDNNEEEANKYINYGELLCSIDDFFTSRDSEEVKNVEKELFKNIEWKIENIEVEEEKATAVVEVKNKDFKYVITRWMKEIVVSKSVNKEITNELLLQKLERSLKEETATKTEIKKITLNKMEEQWKIQVNEELRDLVYPGIDSVITGLSTK